MPRILVVDDEPAILSTLRDILVPFGHEVSTAEDGLVGLERAKAEHFDLVLSDINMEGMDGFDVIHRVKAMKPNLPVVLMTGAASVEYTIRALRMGASNLFMKPLSIRDLISSVFHLVELHR